MKNSCDCPHCLSMSRWDALGQDMARLETKLDNLAITVRGQEITLATFRNAISRATRRKPKKKQHP